MAKTRDQLKLLLLQIRDGHQVRQEELESFAEYCGLKIEQIDVLNVFDTPDFPDTAADQYDALLVGGRVKPMYCFRKATHLLSNVSN